jgi:3-oxoacyl-[acyl-carrier protein] reductase
MRMVFISSMAGLSGTPRSVHYAAAKAAIIGFGKALARELGPAGITVNSIAPGAIDTPMLQLIPAHIREQNVNNPMGRVGTPADIARTILFLTDRDADFITGQVLGVNGGALI